LSYHSAPSQFLRQIAPDLGGDHWLRWKYSVEDGYAHVGLQEEFMWSRHFT
jgi:hypothetical protein